MRFALEQARAALEQGNFPVGVVFVHRGQILASGQRVHTQKEKETVNEIDHAEILALRHFLSMESKVSTAELTVYSTMEPCLMCYSTLILNGIRNIVYAYEDVMGGGTNLPLEQLSPLYREMKIHISAKVLREQSLKLFKQFFSNPENNYWKDSILSAYTLNQSR